MNSTNASRKYSMLRAPPKSPSYAQPPPPTIPSSRRVHSTLPTLQLPPANSTPPSARCSRAFQQCFLCWGRARFRSCCRHSALRSHCRRARPRSHRYPKTNASYHPHSLESRRAPPASPTSAHSMSRIDPPPRFLNCARSTQAHAPRHSFHLHDRHHRSRRALRR
jgi:hypothetical protein